MKLTVEQLQQYAIKRADFLENQEEAVKEAIETLRYASYFGFIKPEQLDEMREIILECEEFPF